MLCQAQNGACTKKRIQFIIIVNMGNGLRALRIKAGMTLAQAGAALGLSESGYKKKERGERELDTEFIRRACELFGVSADEIIGEAGGAAFVQDIDPVRLTELIALSRERVGTLPLDEAKQLIQALISAARRPRGPGGDQTN